MSTIRIRVLKPDPDPEKNMKNRSGSRKIQKTGSGSKTLLLKKNFLTEKKNNDHYF